MCSELEIIVRRKDLNDNDIGLLKNIFNKHKFKGDFIHYKDILQRRIDIQKKNEIFLTEMNEEQRKNYLEATATANDEDDNEKLEFTEIEKNTVAVNIDQYEDTCLCPINDKSMIINLLSELLNHFDDVFYQPYCFVFAGSSLLNTVIENTISLKENDNFDFIPSMGFRPMVKIIL